ncbi:MAG: hypothetical protein O2985_14295 [Proteobacteria bacterium]|nr:hypothetical protein [Pseudomonadota bacterium]
MTLRYLVAVLALIAAAQLSLVPAATAAGWTVCDWPVAKRLADKVSVEGQTVREDFKKIIQCTGQSCPKRVDAVLDLHAKGSEERAVLDACRAMVRKYMDRF